MIHRRFDHEVIDLKDFTEGLIATRLIRSIDHRR
jgi:hypothetical protein